MDWNYSSPLNGALIAASNNNSSNIGLSSTSLYNSSLYPSYDPLLTRYKARANLYSNRLPESIGLFDDLDDLALEVEANDIFSRPLLKTTSQPYVPSYYNPNQLLPDQDHERPSFDENPVNTSNNPPFSLKDDSLNKFENSKPTKTNKNAKTNQIPQQPPPKLSNNNANTRKAGNNHFLKNPKQSTNNQQQQQQQQQPPTNRQYFQQQHTPPQQQQQQPFQSAVLTPNYEYQQIFQPVPFNNNQNIQIQAHNSQQQRLLQYQQRMLQQQQQQQQQQLQYQQQNGHDNGNGMSELELLKIKQQQERKQLLAAIGSNNGSKHNDNADNHNKTNGHSNNHNINANGNNDFFRHHLSYQNSEASIPSTNADPLNSNSPTPPMISNRFDRNPKNYYLNKSTDDSQEPGKRFDFPVNLVN